MKEQLIRKYEKIKNRKLVMAIIIDCIGLSSMLIPGIGESIDFIWAPLSGFFIYMLFPKFKKYAFLGFLEEAVPFMDFIPTAYIAWRQCYIKNHEETLTQFLNKELKQEEIIKDRLK